MAWTITFYVFVSRGMKQEERGEGEDREEHEEAGEEEGRRVRIRSRGNANVSFLQEGKLTCVIFFNS